MKSNRNDLQDEAGGLITQVDINDEQLFGSSSSLCFFFFLFAQKSVFLTRDSSLFVHGSDSAFFAESSQQQSSSRPFIVLYFLIVRLSTTQNMMDCRGSQRDTAEVSDAYNLFIINNMWWLNHDCATHVHDEGNDEHDQRQLQLRVSDVA